MNDMLRKMLLAVIGCMIFTASGADERSRAVLDRMTAKLGSYDSYMVEFTVEIDDDLFGGVEGSLTVSGDKFRIEVEGYEMLSDGRYRYDYNGGDNEVVIDNIDPGDRNLLTNPAKFFLFSEGDHSSAYVGSSGGSETIELRPTGNDAGYSVITLTVDVQTDLPTKISYAFDGAAGSDIIIEKITPNVPVTDAMFTFDRRGYPGVEVIDWR